MNVMKRAILYLTRKKGRTLFMLCLLFLMSLSVLIGISFKTSTEKELDRLRLSMASGFILEVITGNEMYYGHVDYGNGLSNDHDYIGPKITEEMIDKILTIDGVKDCILDFEVTAWTNLELKPAMWARSKPDEHLSEELIKVNCQTTDLYSCRNGATHKNFRTGALTICEGRNIEEGDHFKAVISDWLAENNRLSIGDTITLETKEGHHGERYAPSKTLGEPIEVEIVGLFHANFTQKPTEFTTFEHSYVENIFYTDMDTSAKMQENAVWEGYYSPFQNGYNKAEFLVEDPKELDSIMQQVKNWDEIDLENMEVMTDDTDYRAAANPYRQIRFFSMLLLALGICGIGIILFLVLKLWVQGRKHEIGILRSIGMRKRKILGQMLAECLLLSSFALILAFLLSGAALNQCAAAAERLTAPRADAEEYEVRLSAAFSPLVTKISSDEVVLDHQVSIYTMGFMVLFVCGISCISVIVSFFSISGLDVKKLLM